MLLNFEVYDSKHHCVLDIMANTDAPYHAAVLAAVYVYEKDWSYNTHPTDPRGVTVSPDFDVPDPVIIYIVMR